MEYSRLFSFKSAALVIAALYVLGFTSSAKAQYIEYEEPDSGGMCEVESPSGNHTTDTEHCTVVGYWYDCDCSLNTTTTGSYANYEIYTGYIHEQITGEPFALYAYSVSSAYCEDTPGTWLAKTVDQYGNVYITAQNTVGTPIFYCNVSVDITVESA